MIERHSYYIVDAFSSQPFQGNPVAVFLNTASMSSCVMQKIAQEMNLSECVFINTVNNVPSIMEPEIEVQIFTPVNELPFAGHPLIGAAFVVNLEYGFNNFKFKTEQGDIQIEVDKKEDIGYVRMLQPIPTWTPFKYSEDLKHALSISTTLLPIDTYSNGPNHTIVVCKTVDQLANIKPSFEKLMCFTDQAINCCAMEVGSPQRWRNRMFSPAYGVLEDAATGSAAGPIAIHAMRFGLIPENSRLVIKQGVEMGRNSRMEISIAGAPSALERITLAGNVVLVAKGEMRS